MNWVAAFWFAIAVIAAAVTARRLRRTWAWRLTTVTLLAIIVFVGLSSYRHFIENSRYALQCLTGGAGLALINRTNSLEFVRMDQDCQASLSNLQEHPTHIAGVVLEGNGLSSSRLTLTNEVGQGLVLRLHRTRQKPPFEVVNYWNLTNAIGILQYRP